MNRPSLNLLLTALIFLTPALAPFADAASSIPEEPVAIGVEPQFLHDGYIVDNYWAIKYKRQAVQRVFHQPRKHPANPILSGDQPSYLWVVRDEATGLFRMYYQANIQVKNDSEQGRKYETQIAYAESSDGIQWTRPHLDLFPGRKPKPNSIVVAYRDRPDAEASAPMILDAPEADRRGYKLLMVYRAKGRKGADINGIRIVGSNDGVHWDVENSQRIVHLHSDHANTISYDPTRKEYVLFCRAKDIYRAWGEEMIDTGASRRIARLGSKELWSEWMEHGQPQTILAPDGIDSELHFNFFYGMPTRHYAGVYWGFLEPFRMNDFISAELTTSRDGFSFDRFRGVTERGEKVVPRPGVDTLDKQGKQAPTLGGRPPKLIEWGKDGEWDDTMIFASPGWVEVGDKWFIYYTGWDGDHGTTDRAGAIGLAIVRKEGFYSMRGPKDGGVVATRRIIWPGGDLSINADANGGEIKVRVSDAKRKPIPGYNYEDGKAFTGGSTAHVVQWNGKSLADLKGREVRLEFYLKEADLYTFRATSE